MAARARFQSIDDYIAECPLDVQSILNRIRRIIRKAAPKAVEKISYQIPAFALDGDLVYFAAFKSHIGIFPPVKGDARLQKQLAPYRGPKGNLKFPLDEPIPYALIDKIVRARLKESKARNAAKKRKTK